MTSPYLPYTQSGYADWKKRLPQESAIAGLLNQAKQVAGMAEEPPPALLPPTPPFNPNEGRSTPAGDDPTHAHRKGLLGGLRHLVGADRTAPEVASLLTPDQQARVRPGLLSTVYNAVVEGKGPQEVQRERARTMLDLGDEKKARAKMARDEAMWEQIQGVAAQIPDPQARLEYTARMASSMGLAQGADAAMAAQRLEAPGQTQALAMRTVRDVMGPDGKPYIVTYDGQGNEVSRQRQFVAPANPADDNTIVAIDDGSGNPVYVPRAEAIGKKPWQAPPRPGLSTARVQETYRRKSAALDDLNKAIDVYRTQLDQTGVEIMPGPSRSRLTGAYANLKLLAKEAANLGALTGPDVKILEELFNDPATFRSAGMNVLEGGKRKQSLLEQLDQYRAIINGQRRTLEENYSREIEMAGPSGSPTAPASDKTMTQAEFNRLSPAAQAAARSSGYTITP